MRPTLTSLHAVAAALGAVTAGAAVLIGGGPGALAVVVALVAGGGMLLPTSGTEGSYALGLATVLVPVAVALAVAGGAVAAIALATGAAATAEASGLARRASTRAAVAPTVVRAELTGSAVVVALTLVAGGVVVLVGWLPAPGGFLAEGVALVALVGLGALAASSPAIRASVRALVDR